MKPFRTLRNINSQKVSEIKGNYLIHSSKIIIKQTNASQYLISRTFITKIKEEPQT